MLAKKPKGATRKQSSGGSMSGLFWMFGGALLTLMIGLFLYLWNPFDMGHTEVQAVDSTVKPKINTDQDNEYEFYDLLPEQQITSIPDEAILTNQQPEPDRAESMTPDVVVLVPTQTQRSDDGANNANAGNANSGNNNNAQNYGISEDTILNPLSEQQAPARARPQNNGIVVVEEPETYDGTDATANTGNSNNTANNANSNVNSNVNNNANSGNTVAAKPATSQRNYILQINSFTNADEADRRRAQVLMAGVDAKVIKNETANGQQIYQVISNKMNNRQAVVNAQQKLQNNGIDSLIVEQRR